MAKGGSLLYAIIGILVISVAFSVIISQKTNLGNNNIIGSADKYIIIGTVADKQTCENKCYQQLAYYASSYTLESVQFYSSAGVKRCQCALIKRQAY